MFKDCFLFLYAFFVVGVEISKLVSWRSSWPPRKQKFEGPVMGPGLAAVEPVERALWEWRRFVGEEVRRSRSGRRWRRGSVEVVRPRVGGRLVRWRHRISEEKLIEGFEAGCRKIAETEGVVDGWRNSFAVGGSSVGGGEIPPEGGQHLRIGRGDRRGLRDEWRMVYHLFRSIFCNI